MRRAVAVALAFCLVAAADDKRVAELLVQANGEFEAAKEIWNKFVFAANDVTDAQLTELLARYDKAIDLCQKASESADSGEADTMVVRLARRTAQLRATIFARQMRARAEEAQKTKPPQPDAPPEPKQPEKPPEKPREAKPQPEAQEPAPATELVLPEIAETKEQRSRGMQSARDFLMNFYFSNRRRDAVIDQCVHCKGSGTVRLPYNDPKTQKPWKQDCGGCRATGYLFNEPVARKGLWLCWSPLYRQAEKARWEQDVTAYRNDPRRIPEFLTSVRIVKVEYHGLWADAEWEEKGASADGKKFARAVSRRLIRAGRQWFFFDPERDKEFFGGKPEAD